jgi:Tol biopolymer transport system component
MSVWDILENLYLDRGWRVDEGEDKTLIIRPVVGERENDTSAKERIEFFGLDLTEAPSTTKSADLPDLFEELPPGSKSYEIAKDVAVAYSGLDGTVYYIPEKEIFYIQHDKLGSSTLTYYGPFNGDPHQVLGLEKDVPGEGESSKTIRQIPMPKDVRSSREFSWFPNSQRIATRLVQRLDKNDFRSVIAVVEVESGKIKILSEPNVKHSNPACAPDGKTIAYIGPMGEHSTIWVMDANGENRRPLVNVRCWHRPVWSADGKHLVFTERNNDIWAVNADGSGLKQLTSGPGSRSRPKWSPDGNLIAFVANDEIWLMQADGSNRRVLTEIVSKPGYRPIGDWDDFYDWSPDGKQIVCAYRPIPPEGEHVTHDGGIHPYQIWIVNIDGSNKHCVTPEDISCGHPIWAPDNRHILFESVYKWVVTKTGRGPYPKRNIWMLDLVEKKKQQLTNTRRITEFALSPDGRKVVFSTEDEKSIFVADWLEGG